MKEGSENNEIVIAWELTPFLDKIRTMKATSRGYKFFMKAYFDFRDKFEKRKKIFDMLQEQPLFYPNLYVLYLYLGAIESWGSTVIDVLVLLLVANGIDFRMRGRTIRVASMEELESENLYIPLSDKLRFLKENKIERFGSVINCKFRNAIAHLNFNIIEKEIYWNGRLAIKEAFDGLTRLLNAVVMTSACLNKLAIDMKWIK